jgi:hypothetical protein
MKRVAFVDLLISAGVIAATLSSAMASFLGAPRILQSLALDRIFSFLLPFSKGAGPSENPRRGVLLSAGIAFATIGLGKLNVIASVVSMFFLISYGLLNYATYFEARASSPSFRPQFRWFKPRLSLIGFLACLGAMLAINLAAGAIAVAVLFAIYQYLKRTAGPARWADSRRSYHLQRIREHLLAASAEPEHPRDWRPQLLAFSDDPNRRKQLLRLASWLEGGSGLTTAVQIVEGEGVKMLKIRAEAEEALRTDIKEHDLKAFPLVVAAPDLTAGIHALVQAFGIGPLRVNTFLLNWLDQPSKGVPGLGELRYARNLRAAFRFGCNIVILDAEEEEWVELENLPPKDRCIDVWWWGDATSRLMLLLAYLMTRSEGWDQARIRVLAAGREEDSEGTLEDLKNTLQEVRIEAEPEIVANPTAGAISRYSAESAIIFVPFRLRTDQLVDPFGGPLEEFLSPLPVVIMALAAEDIDLDAEPEEGTAGEMAAALDAHADAEKKAQEAEKQAAKAAEEAEKAEKKLLEMQAAADPGADYEDISKLEAAALEARERSEQMARRAAKAMAKAEDAARAVEALGAKPAENQKDPDKTSDSEKGQKPSQK